MANSNDPALPKDVAEKYKLVKLIPATYEIPGFGTVDFTAIDLKLAARIAKATPYLVEKVPKAVQNPPAGADSAK